MLLTHTAGLSYSIMPNLSDGEFLSRVVDCFCSHSNSDMLTHTARGRPAESSRRSV